MFRPDLNVPPRPEFRAALRQALLGRPPTPAGWRLPVPGGHPVYIRPATTGAALVLAAVLLGGARMIRGPQPAPEPAVGQAGTIAGPPTSLRAVPPGAAAPRVDAPPPVRPVLAAAVGVPAARAPEPARVEAAAAAEEPVGGGPLALPPAGAAQAPKRERDRVDDPPAAAPTAIPSPTPAAPPTDAPTATAVSGDPPATSTPIQTTPEIPTVTPPPPEPPLRTRP